MKKAVIIGVVVSVLLGFQQLSYGFEFFNRTIEVINKPLNLETGSVLGVGVVYAQQPYVGVDNTIMPVPIIIAKHKRFFVDGISSGYYLTDNKDVNLAVIVAPRFNGYDSGDSDFLSGMDDREWSFDGGLKLKWNNDITDVSVTVLTDLLDEHQGQEVRLKISKKMFRGFFTPRIGVRWQSDDLTDYYYGVKGAEATVDRPEYSPGNSLDYMVGVMFAIPIDEKWAATLDIQYDFLSDNIKDSSIVDEDQIGRFILGMAYRF